MARTAAALCLRSFTTFTERGHADVKRDLLTLAVHAHRVAFLQSTMWTPVSPCSVYRAVLVACKKYITRNSAMADSLTIRATHLSNMQWRC